MIKNIDLIPISTCMIRDWDPFTYKGVDKKTSITWKMFTAEIPGSGFIQENVEFPDFFSQQAVNIISSKYFYGKLGSEDRESSFKHLIERVALTVVLWGLYQKYFDEDISNYFLNELEQAITTDGIPYNVIAETAPHIMIWKLKDILHNIYANDSLHRYNSTDTINEVIVFYRDLIYLLVNQYAAFNSPVWFNLGNPYAENQISACFITGLEDTLESIAENNNAEMMIFRHGSGAGKNSSKLRSTFETLSGGGIPSGPCSFMKINDVTANVTKSGGKCYRKGTLVSTPNGLVKIEDIKVNDEVNTHTGVKKVLEIMDNGIKPLYTVLTKEGYQVDVTKDHEFAYWNNTLMQFSTKPISEFNENEQIYLLISESEGAEQRLSIPEPIENSHATTTMNIKYPEKITPELAYILGTSYGNGYVSNEQLKISFSNQEHGQLSLSKVSKYFKEIFDIDATINSGDGECSVVNGNRVLLTRFLEHNQLLKGKASNLEFPEKIMNATKDVKYAFIAGYLDTDGAFQKRGGYTVSSIDDAFLRKLQIMLLTLGIPCKIKKEREEKENWKTLWKLSINNKIFLEKLQEGILPYSSKAELLFKENIQAKGWGFKNLSFSSFLHITEKGMKTELDYKFGRGGNTIPYSSVKHFADTYPNTTLGKKCNMLIQTVPLNIKSITFAGVDNTYDIEVEDVHLLSANGIYASNSRRAAKLEMLNIDHGDIMEFIEQKVKEERKIKILAQNGYSTNFTDPNNAYSQVFFQNSNQSVRVTDAFMKAVENNENWYTLERYDTILRESVKHNTRCAQGLLYECHNGVKYILSDKDKKVYKVIHEYKAKDLFHTICASAWECADPGMMFHDTINKMNPVIHHEEIVACNPCAEYIFLDDTSCNLASLNLLKFFKTGYIKENIDNFKKAIRIFTISMDILIGMAHYPTEKIRDKTRKYRTIGLGPANLGALLMSHGIAYDSDHGREMAGKYMALITLEAYKTSQLLAERFGAFEGYNDDIMQKVISSHLRWKGPASQEDIEFLEYESLMDSTVGYRNAQVTVCAPTGTISFIMDCDTTGIECAFALKSYKKLVGGGTMELPVNAVFDGLKALGYNKEVADKYASGKAPLKDLIKPEHYGVFASAIGEFPLTWEAHIKMTAEIQKYVSGGISKTINMPADSTIDDIKKAYMMAWKEGLKGISVYRDGCKSSQPLSDKKEETKEEANNVVTEEKSYSGNGKRRVSPTASAVRHAFSIGGQEGYIHVGLFDDGTPGEIFITMGKSGSTVNGLIGELSKSYSWNLQYGMPLEKIISKLKNTKFEPAGITDNPDIRFASSIVDYIAKWLELYFIKKINNIKELDEIVKPIETKVILSATQHTGEICRICGGLMVKSGTCETCTSCGETTGCG